MYKLTWLNLEDRILCKSNKPSLKDKCVNSTYGRGLGRAWSTETERTVLARDWRRKRMW